jgi:hypothetical protein
MACETNETELFNEFSHIIEQLIFINDNDPSGLSIKNLNDPLLTSKIDRLLLNLAILKEGKYTTSQDVQLSAKKSDLLNEFTSVFHYYLTNRISLKNSETLKAVWHRSKSNHWSYLVT